MTTHGRSSGDLEQPKRRIAWGQRTIDSVAAILVGFAMLIATASTCAPDSPLSPGDAFSDGLLFCAVATKAIEGPFVSHGLMKCDTPMVAQKLPNAPAFISENRGYRDLYSSQSGLHAVVFSLLAPEDPARWVEWFAGLKTVAIWLVAVATAVFAFGLRRTHGIAAALVLPAAFSLKYMYLPFAASVYWLWGLHQIVPALVTMIYPMLDVGRGRRRLAAAIFILATIKFLCGYEFAPLIIGGAVIPVVFHEIRRKSAPKIVLLKASMWLIPGLAGFATAIAVHLTQLTFESGGIGQAFDSFAHLVTKRSIENPQYPSENWREPMFVVREYLEQWMFAFPLGSRFVSINLAAFLTIFIAVSAFQGVTWIVGKLDRHLMASLVAAWITVPLTFSWIVLVRQHAHTHVSHCQAMFTIILVPWVVAHLVFSLQWLIRSIFRKAPKVVSATAT